MPALAPRDYARLRPLLERVPSNTLFAQVVLDGDVPGSVWADDPEQPRTCYVRHPYGMSLLWGEPGRAGYEADLLRHLARSEEAMPQDEWLQVHPLHGELLVGLERSHWGARRVTRLVRINFAFRPARPRPAAALPAGMQVQPTGLEQFDRIMGAVVPRRFWRDREHFQQAGVGFSVIKDGEPVATAFSSFVKGHQLEIGIETHPEHRGQGLAAIACTHLIDHCREHGLEPIWSCREDNTGSMRLAHRLGFVPTRRLPYYHLAP